MVVFLFYLVEGQFLSIYSYLFILSVMPCEWTFVNDARDGSLFEWMIGTVRLGLKWIRIIAFAKVFILYLPPEEKKRKIQSQVCVCICVRSRSSSKSLDLGKNKLNEMGCVYQYSFVWPHTYTYIANQKMFKV